MAGKTARKKPDRTKARAPVIKSVIAPDEVHAEEAALPDASTESEVGSPNDVASCTRSHTPNARTRKALRDADAGKNLTRYVNADDLFRKLGIKLGQEKA